MPADLSAIVTILEECAVPTPGDAAKLESLVRYALVVEGRTGDWEISIALVEDGELRRLHRDFLGLDTVTDIMTSHTVTACSVETSPSRSTAPPSRRRSSA